ncbi:MAG TPA: response regulator transcription factor [Puia sp.]|jgi:DNA-binding NarL/FixJ family response regulator|nr:response regulator transcription factor [Puia sp.]
MLKPLILVADDHIMISKGLRRSIELEFGFTDVHSVTSCSNVMNELKAKPYTHLILDIGLSDGSALEILPAIKRLYPEVRILVFSSKPTSAFERALAQQGVHDYLSKEQTETETTTILTDFFYSRQRRIKKELMENPFAALSPREWEVTHHLLLGEATSEVANRLNLKSSSVSTIKGRILEKLGVDNLRDFFELARLYNVE